jgi:hypothetical protein
MKWLKKALGMTISPHVFAKVNPDHPHGGLDHFSESNHFPLSIKVEGLTLEEAKRELCGKVIDWSRITEKEMKAIEGKKVVVTVEELKRMFR